MKKHITLFLLLISFAGFSQDDFVEFKKDNFSINYPKNWILDTSGQMNSSFIIFSPTTENDLFNENINLLIQDITGQDLNLESYSTISENQIKSMIPNLKWLKNEKVGNHQEVIWSGLVTNNNLKFKQIYYVINNKAYVLTFSAHESVYDDYIKIGNKILESFQVN